jgi:hypothetical protein
MEEQEQEDEEKARKESLTSQQLVQLAATDQAGHHASSPSVPKGPCRSTHSSNEEEKQEDTAVDGEREEEAADEDEDGGSIYNSTNPYQRAFNEETIKNASKGLGERLSPTYYPPHGAKASHTSELKGESVNCAIPHI